MWWRRGEDACMVCCIREMSLSVMRSQLDGLLL